MVMCVAGASLMAQFHLPLVLGDNMVLQRDRRVSVWGWAKPDENISVHFGAQKKTAITGRNGEWLLYLDPMPANASPADMTIAAGDTTVQLHNILVGEVWLCSGQSNMEYSMRKNSKFEKTLHGDGPANELDSAHNRLSVFSS